MNCPYCGKKVITNYQRIDKSHSARFRWQEIRERKSLDEANLYIHMGWVCTMTRNRQRWKEATGYGIECSVCEKWYALYRTKYSLAEHIMATKDMSQTEHALFYLLAEDH
jgi:sarcosine oxidase delta subunit